MVKIQRIPTASQHGPGAVYHHVLPVPPLLSESRNTGTRESRRGLARALAFPSHVSTAGVSYAVRKNRASTSRTGRVGSANQVKTRSELRAGLDGLASKRCGTCRRAGSDGRPRATPCCATFRVIAGRAELLVDGARSDLPPLGYLTSI
jgi:hypothetical protein